MDNLWIIYGYGYGYGYGYNVGITIINHPPNHHRYLVETIFNGWFIIVIPTLHSNPNWGFLIIQL